ncbi:TorF family putative porin [Polynucleobacter aenigmaticus]|uniref:TorF family putative porin n=1 Tax=Polynucleobacter aenigmaticus TaxID=1743164 RepID=UPI00197DFB9C|nr:TorF family putative porin [Polynucleobacter aenigmaticus]
MKTIQKTAIALAASGLFATAAFAQTAPAAPEAPEASPVTANVSLVSDYRYRGISQSNLRPAIQGGFDYAHESGFYIGNWNSSITWVNNLNPNVSSGVEMDFYAGVKKELIGEGFASDLGVLQYYYPTSGNFTSPSVNPNTTEIYAAQNYTFGPVTGFLKFSYAVTNTFGNQNSSGSYYPDLTANYDTGIWGLALNAHVGYQYIAGTPAGTSTSNSSLYSYTDWKLGVTKDFGGGLSLAAAYIGTDAKKVGSTYAYVSPSGKNLGGSTGVVTLTKTF